MSKQDFIRRIKDKLRDVDLRIAERRTALGRATDDRRKVELGGELRALESIRAQLRERLERLEAQPEETFSERRAEWQDDWLALVRDLEERVSRLA